MFIPATIHQAVYTYWLNTYNNIRNANIILDRLGVTYDPSVGSIKLTDIKLPVADAERKQVAGEALFIRAYHYFNMVRLYGGVFLAHTPLTAAETKTMTRASVDDIYKLIEADLSTAVTYMSAAKYNAASATLGRATAWSAKALLGKVYLTRNKKAEAITQLQDVITNSGHSLLPNYADVFSINNEMNAEILFAVRYKAGGFGLGSTFGNDFAPVSSGIAIINGDGDGNNYPSLDLDTVFTAIDKRKPVSMALWTTKYYAKKFVNQVVLTDDGEGDWPVLRFADVLLMMAEAKGFTPESIALQFRAINPRTFDFCRTEYERWSNL
jgi:starch-binding outer membrane protein, SusD/RagB family